MNSTHPDVEQLSEYMECPESSQHSTIRKHLMACDHCRGRVDKLAQLEFDIRHYIPRFGQQSVLPGDDYNTGEEIERFVDNPLDDEKSQSVKKQINASPESLKAALHYAVHSSAMRKNINTTSADISTGEYRSKSSFSSFGSGFSKMFRYLQWPAPVWVMAPATLLLATIISLPLFYSQPGSQNTGPLIAKFQDNAAISYSSADIPAGSIGFFHDAKTHSEPFSGIDISINMNKELELNWQAVNKATSYLLKVYSVMNNEKNQIIAKKVSEPRTTLSNLEWETGKHYQWQLSGTTDDGLKFSTNGDFVIFNNNLN